MSGLEKYVKGKSKMTRNLLKNNPKLAALSHDDIKALEQKIADQFGFANEEVRFIVTHKPSVLLLEDAESDTKMGLVALQKYFVEEQGFSEELTRTLITKYPHILSKTTDHIE